MPLEFRELAEAREQNLKAANALDSEVQLGYTCPTSSVGKVDDESWQAQSFRGPYCAGALEA